MTNITEIKLPERFSAFAEGKDLERSSKALNFFLKCKAIHLKGDEEEELFLNSVKVALVLNKNLKSHQVLKLVCHCPELASQSGRFIEAFKDFEELLKMSSKDKPFYRAKKIALLLRANPALPSPTNLDMLLTSSDGRVVMIDRFSWAAAIPAWRPMLMGKIEQRKPVDLSEKFLKTIDHFIKENTLSEQSLSMDELLQLFTTAEGLRFIRFKKKCAKALIKHLNGETVLEILRRGLDCKSPHLIDFCLQFLHENEESLSLSWNAIHGLRVELKSISENTLAILETISPDIYRVSLAGQAVVDQAIARGLQFPHANVLSFHGEIDPMIINALAPLFPTIKSFSLPSSLYQKLKADHAANWTNVETLHVRGKGEFNWMPLFPSLKLFIRESEEKLELREENGILVCHLGSKTCPLLDLSPFSSLITDQMLIDFIQYLPGCNTFDLKGCTRLTEKLGQTIVRHLVRRVLNLLNDSGSLKSKITIKSEGLDPSILVAVRKLLVLNLPACEVHILVDRWNFYLIWCLI